MTARHLLKNLPPHLTIIFKVERGGKRKVLFKSIPQGDVRLAVFQLKRARSM
jgi:hypothetical protein